MLILTISLQNDILIAKFGHPKNRGLVFCPGTHIGIANFVGNIAIEDDKSRQFLLARNLRQNWVGESFNIIMGGSPSSRYLNAIDRDVKKIKNIIKKIEKDPTTYQDYYTDGKKTDPHTNLSDVIPKIEAAKQRTLNRMDDTLDTFLIHCKDMRDLSVGKWSKKWDMKIQLYYAEKTERTPYVVEELKKTLTTLTSEHDMPVHLETHDDQSGIDANIPLMVICLCSSRLDSDFENSVRNVHTGPNVAVLMFHYKREDDLPKRSSKDALMTDKCKKVGAIIDVAVYDKSGLYKCEMNKTADEEIISFIKNIYEI